MYKRENCEPLKHLQLTALMLKIVSSLGRGCWARIWTRNLDTI